VLRDHESLPSSCSLTERLSVCAILAGGRLSNVTANVTEKDFPNTLPSIPPEGRHACASENAVEAQ
jgi:hypothetical protein